jgi:hypothetical protein
MQQVAWLAWREQVYVASPGCESTDRSVVRPVSGVGAEGCGVRVREAVTNRSVYLGYSRGWVGLDLLGRSVVDAGRLVICGQSAECNGVTEDSRVKN